MERGWERAWLTMDAELGREAVFPILVQSALTVTVEPLQSPRADRKSVPSLQPQVCSPIMWQGRV